MSIIKKRLTALTILILSYMIYYSYHHYFTIGMLEGSYVNTNYEYGPFVAEMPYGQDSIHLDSDMSFSSTCWGNGQYEIEYSLKGTKLDFSYTYALGTAGIQTYIERRFFSQPRIMIVRDMNHYMRKIEN